MKVTRDTQDQLIVEHRAYLALLALIWALVFPVPFGIAFSLSGEWLGWIVLLAGIWLCVWVLEKIERVQLILDRSAGTVTLRRRTLRGYVQKVFDLSALDQALLETERDGNLASHHAFLIFKTGMDAGKHPLTLVSSSIEGHKHVVNAINGWLGNGIQPVP